MTPLLWRASLRHLVRHPWQIGLSVLGIALGVAVALAIGLATESARRAFELATEAVTGRATHQIVGGPAGLPEEIYRTIRLDLAVPRAAPVVAVDVALPDHPGRVMQLMGVDPFAETPFRPHLAGEEPLRTVSALLTRPGAMLMSGPAARELGLSPGATLMARVAGVRRPLVLVGTFEPVDSLSTQALESVLVTDIATAQEVAGLRGRLSRIDLMMGYRPVDRALLERIREALPPGAELVRAGAQAGAIASMTAAFTLNLRALSLLALVVGMFLIYNTMTFSVVQRRTLLGTLRALGVTRGQVFGLIAVEALAMGAVGTLLGIGLGLGLAQGLLHLVTRTINDLYFALSVREVYLTPVAVLQAVALGLGTTLLAALAPAREATGIRPREALLRSRLESASRRAAPRAALLGVALGGLGLVLLLPNGPVWGFMGLFALLMGTALVTPLAVTVILAALDVPIAHAGGLLGRMAARGITAALSRTGVAIAALMIAVSATVGVGIMIASFREAVIRWLEGTLRADVYVSPPSLIGARPDSTLDPALIERLATTPGVAAAGTARGVTVASPRGPVNVVAIGVAAGQPPGFTFKRGRPEAVWPALERGWVIVSEPFAYRHRVGVEDSVRLRTEHGEVRFRIAGIFYDYGSSAGVVIMSRATYERHWADRGVSSVGDLRRARHRHPDAHRRAARARRGGAQRRRGADPLQPRAPRGLAGDLRPHLRGHPGPAPPHRGGGLRGRALRPHGARARARARDGPRPRARPHPRPGVGCHHRADRPHRTGGGAPRDAGGRAAGRRARVRDQPPLVRLDHAHRRAPRDLAPGPAPRGGGGGARRRVPGGAHGARVARGGAPR
jgi:putative ABC transport system permease protein